MYAKSRGNSNIGASCNHNITTNSRNPIQQSAITSNVTYIVCMTTTTINKSKILIATVRNTIYTQSYLRDAACCFKKVQGDWDFKISRSWYCLELDRYMVLY